MKTVRFTETRTVDYLDGEGLRVYEAGTVHTLRDDKAQRWVTRGVAVFCDPEPEAPPAPVETPAPAPAPEPAPPPSPAASPESAKRGPKKSKQP